MNLGRTLLASLTFTTLFLASRPSAEAQEYLGGITREVDRLGFPKAIPVHVTGFSGEADATLSLKSLIEPLVSILKIVIKALMTITLLKHEVDLLLGDDTRVGGLPDFASQC